MIPPAFQTDFIQLSNERDGHTYKHTQVLYIIRREFENCQCLSVIIGISDESHILMKDLSICLLLLENLYLHTNYESQDRNVLIHQKTRVYPSL